MNKTLQGVVILVTAKDLAEAQSIAQGLLNQKLIACANIVREVQSLFWWQGKVDAAAEALLIIKTEQRLCNEVIRAVKSLHSYETPEIIALPIIEGNEDYLKWIHESIR